MKKILLLALCFASLGVYASVKDITLYKADGSTLGNVLSVKQITFSDGKINLVTADKTESFPLSEVAAYTYGSPLTSVDDILADGSGIVTVLDGRRLMVSAAVAITSVKVYSVAGSLVAECSSQSGQATLDVPGNAGIYIAQITTADSSKVVKLKIAQ